MAWLPHTCSWERTTHTVCWGVRLRSRLQQAASSQLQVLFPRPRRAAYHLEVSPLAWGGTRAVPLLEPPGRAARVRMRVRSSALCPASSFLCTASSAGPFALRFCQFEDELERSQSPSCL